jgi:hypothetical protein
MAETLDLARQRRLAGRQLDARVLVVQGQRSQGQVDGLREAIVVGDVALPEVEDGETRFRAGKDRGPQLGRLAPPVSDASAVGQR